MNHQEDLLTQKSFCCFYCNFKKIIIITLRRSNYHGFILCMCVFNFSRQWSVTTCWILCQLTDKTLKGMNFGCYQLNNGGSLIFTVNTFYLGVPIPCSWLFQSKSHPAKFTFKMGSLSFACFIMSSFKNHDYYYVFL